MGKGQRIASRQRRQWWHTAPEVGGGKPRRLCSPAGARCTCPPGGKGRLRRSCAAEKRSKGSGEGLRGSDGNFPLALLLLLRLGRRRGRNQQRHGGEQQAGARHGSSSCKIGLLWAPSPK